MDEILEQFKKTFSIFGLNLDIFPGIPIALIPLYFFVNKYKEKILSLIHANELNDVAQTSIIFIVILILGVCVWKLSGYILDPIYDKISPSKTNQNSELNIFIKRAREKWATIDSIYANESVSIYMDTVDLLKRTDIEEYNEVKLTLAASKLFRIVVIPIILLGIVNIVSKEYGGGIILIAVAILCLIVSFSYRAEQSRKIYRWFLNQN